FELLHDRRDRPPRGLGLELLVEDVLVRVDVLVHEVGKLLHVHPRLLRVLEFHRRAPLWRCRHHGLFPRSAPFAGAPFRRAGGSMLDLIYSVPTWLLGVLIVGLSAALPMLGLVIVHRLVPLEVRRPQNDIAGYISNIAAFVYAVLLAFLAVSVWQDYGNAQATVHVEANAANNVF